jgi:group I intron endonuclease
MKTFTVYKHTSPSGKVYIGITMQAPAKRWGREGVGYKHSPHFLAAIQKYGWDNIHHEIIAEGLNQAEAEQLEIELIAKYKAADKAHGYNIDLGGSMGPKHSETTRAKIGAANHGRIWSPESKQKLREYKLAHPTSSETAKKIGDANRGRKHRPESVEKIRAAQTCKAVRDLTTGTWYSSVMDAARACGLDPSKIVAVCKGKRKTHGGRAWAYEEVIP